MKNSTLFLFLVATFILFPTTARTDYAIFPDMSMNATPNPIGSGARALGFGGAFIAVADDATAASWNPGGLIKLKRPEISFVESSFSADMKYNTRYIEGDIVDSTPEQIRLNYFSAAFPFYLFKRNMVFSLNYQYLYEFSKDTLYELTYNIQDPESGIVIVDIPGIISRKTQRGVLSTLSPAFAIQITPFLYVGVTANFWLEKGINNYWENLNILKGEGKVVKEDGKKRIKIYGELYERYAFSGIDVFDFSCFNLNIGFLWKARQWFTIGAVVKTPFEAGIRREFQHSFIEEYPDNPDLNRGDSLCMSENLLMKMPLSYGIGCSIQFSDLFLLALDIYRTHWEDYIIEYPTGRQISPITNEYADKAGITTTTQIRLGAEFFLDYPYRILPLRAGIFYDPEPSSGRADDFYGLSAGLGYLFGDLVFDIAYQYRFGKKRDTEYMLGREITSDIKQHYLYSSLILHF